MPFLFTGLSELTLDNPCLEKVFSLFLTGVVISETGHELLATPVVENVEIQKDSYCMHITRLSSWENVCYLLTVVQDTKLHMFYLGCNA